MLDRRSAQRAADAAALAGVTAGRGAAERMAAANGASLVAYGRTGADVIVTVTVDSIEPPEELRRG